MLPEKPYALSCDRNGEPILEVLKQYLSSKSSLLEIGAGTGQHAVFMAPHFQGLKWTLADREDRHEGIKMWLKDFPRANIQGPVEYEIESSQWPQGEFDVVFAANIVHIISWDLNLKLFDELAKLPEGSLFIVYGPFNYNGVFTAESNEKFHAWLMEKFPEGGGIKDFEEVQKELGFRGFNLLKDHEMPANNRTLVFEKSLRH